MTLQGLLLKGSELHSVCPSLSHSYTIGISFPMPLLQLCRRTHAAGEGASHRDGGRHCHALPRHPQGETRIQAAADSPGEECTEECTLSYKRGRHQSGLIPRHTQEIGIFKCRDIPFPFGSSSLPPGQHWVALPCCVSAWHHTCVGVRGPTEKLWNLKGMWAASRGRR